MPYRIIQFYPGEIYHVFNRSVASQDIFVDPGEYKRGLEVMSFYSYPDPGIRFSYYNRFPQDRKRWFIDDLKKTQQPQVNLLCFCFMPNHVHFLVQEVNQGGLAKFMRNFQNSYAKYFNTKNQRIGAVFQSMFKANKIENGEQLIHVARYIHLNPVTAYLLNNAEELETYPWTSYPDYLGKKRLGIVVTNPVLSLFSSVDKFREFTRDQVDYQRELAKIKDLVWD